MHFYCTNLQRDNKLSWKIINTLGLAHTLQKCNCQLSEYLVVRGNRRANEDKRMLFIFLTTRARAILGTKNLTISSRHFANCVTKN